MVVVNKIVLLSPTTEEFVILSSFSISRKTVLPAGQERHDFVAGSNDKPWDFAASSVVVVGFACTKKFCCAVLFLHN